MKKIFVGSDHGGFALKARILAELPKLVPGIDLVDLGCENETSVDYPDYAAKVAAKVVAEKTQGILLCGTGIGISIAANKIAGVRAALVHDVTTARLARQHNDANILCLGGRVVGPEVALDAAVAFLHADFEGGRHQRRVDRIHSLEGQ